MLFKKMLRIGVMVAAIALSGCVNDKTGSQDERDLVDSFDFAAMFVNYADTIIIPNYRSVEQEAASLVSSNGFLPAYCAAIGTVDETTALVTAKNTWLNLQRAIQRSESHIIGPATDNGEALRSRLNAFHVGSLSTCGIDQAVVLASQDAAFDVASRTATQRGIGAVEYLLFNTDLTHTCPSQIDETLTWNARTEDERKQLRCDYAAKVAGDIAIAAESLVDAWSTDKGNYRSAFINPNNAADSLEALSDAMFYMEVEVKDVKLGIPTGIDDGCVGFACADDVESPYSQSSLQNIRVNLEAFIAMLTGSEGLGFDDIINQAGVSDLNERFLANAADAIAMIDSQTESLLTQVMAIDDAQAEAGCTNAFANPSVASDYPACSLYGQIKLITDDLKIGFVATVNVDLPDRSQSDND